MPFSTEDRAFSDLDLNEEVALEISLLGQFYSHAIADPAGDVHLLFHAFLLNAAAVAAGAKMLDFFTSPPAGAAGGLHDERALAHGLRA